MRFKFYIKKCKIPIWSIGIYKYQSALNSELLDNKLLNNFQNPVLTAKDVKDFIAEFVADPFMVREGSKWYMFFEVLCKYDNKGYIGLATSDSGEKWEYQKIILAESFHLSYPYVFKYLNEYYMMPECGESGYIKLYKADKFPEKWICIKDLIEGEFRDASIFERENKFWILAEKRKGEERNVNLHLYYSENLFYGWKEHPKSPIVKNSIHMARPAGRIIVDNEKIFRFAQDDDPYYGKRIRMFQITKITTDDYEEKEIEINLKGTEREREWNSAGMHHIDIHELELNQWIACVDGHFFKERTVLYLKIEKIVIKILKYILKIRKLIKK